MKSVKVMYVAAFFAVAAVFALFEYGVLPPALIPDTPENRYVGGELYPGTLERDYPG